MGFYDEMAATALDLINEFGQPVTIIDVTPGEYDPGVGGTGPDTPVERAAQGILLDFTGYEFQSNTLIQQGDKKLKIAAKGLNVPPSLLSKVICQGRTWSIVPPLKEINPAGTPLVYELQVRS